LTLNFIPSKIGIILQRNNSQKLKQHIPNAITSLNLLFGCLSILAALEGNLTQAALFIGLSAVMDFFDGFVARLLNVSGELGKQLDSLADVVSFGVAPGFIFYGMAGTCFGPDFCINQYTFLLIPIFSAIRLAKFNIDTRQSDSFIGVPTPANAMFISSLPFIVEQNPLGLAEVINHPWFLSVFPVLSAYMLVAELPLLALKFKNFSLKGNEARYVLIAGSLISILFFQIAGVALSILLYILISVVNNYLKTN